MCGDESTEGRKYLLKVSLKCTERFKMQEQHIETRCEGADRNRAFVMTIVGLKQLSFTKEAGSAC